MAGTWIALNHQPSFSANAMVLLTDGTVLVQQLASNNWWTLTPDASGSYVNGSWSQKASSHNGPTYYASSILRDGRWWMAGGEDNFGNNGVDIDAAEIFDPVANTWTTTTTPGWGWIGDAPACMLTDGRIIMGSINDTRTAIYDPVSNSWTAGPAKNDASSEETWTLQPDGTVLCAEVNASPAAEKYVPGSNSWVSAGTLPAGHALVLTTPASTEIGPAILMPDGRTFAIGATGHTALYTPPASPTLPGSWSAGPDFTADANGNPWRAFDAPAALLPNGKVLCIVGPADPSGWAGPPIHAFEFDGTTLTQVGDPPNGAGVQSWYCRLLLLPTGEVLCSVRSNNLQIYRPDGAPNPAWAPSLSSPPASIAPGHSFTLQGTQLNGLSQANSYGDDAQMATNFPLVRITASDGHVYYCRTSNFSTMGVATGSALVSATVAVPLNVPLGAAQMCVVANGIATCVPVTVSNKVFKLEVKEIKEKDVKIEKVEVKEHKDIKNEKIEKAEVKEHKDSKIEKLEKAETKEHKDSKIEKVEKNEVKEHKDGKIEKHEKIEFKEVEKLPFDTKQPQDTVKTVGDTVGKFTDGKLNEGKPSDVVGTVGTVGTGTTGAAGTGALAAAGGGPARAHPASLAAGGPTHPAAAPLTPFITRDERPAVGEAALKAASSQPKGPKKPRTRR